MSYVIHRPDDERQRVPRESESVFVLLSYPATCICLLLASCASVPKETYLTKRSVSRFTKVAVVASSADPSVSFSSEASMASGHGLLVAFLELGGLAVDAVLVSAIEGVSTLRIGKQVDVSQIRDSLAGSFITPVKQAAVFQTVNYIRGHGSASNEQLTKAGYGAAIRLFVRTLSLNRYTADSLSLCVEVRGEMVDLSSGKVLWDRQEQVLGEEYHPLDYYVTNGLVGLDVILRKAATRLANDFVYLN